MSYLDDSKDYTADLKDALGLNNGPGNQVIVEEVSSSPYQPNKSDWHKALPYGFQFNSRGGTQLICYLPLAPENIAVSTHFGTNVIPTLYGTIEEHSEQRYYDIVLSGTTGFAPKYTVPFEADSQPADKKGDFTGRKSYKDEKVAGIDPNLAGGFFQKSIGALNQGLNTIASMYENVNGASVTSGINPQTSGYIAFHNLYRYLLAYKRDAAGLNGNKSYKQHPLTFLNYKDHLKYDCAIMKFDLKRSASQPMLYNYTITMRAYNLRDLSESPPGGAIADRLKDLGLDGVEGSVFQKLKQTSNGAKGVIGAFSGGLNVLGG